MESSNPLWMNHGIVIASQESITIGSEAILGELTKKYAEGDPRLALAPRLSSMIVQTSNSLKLLEGSWANPGLKPNDTDPCISIMGRPVNFLGFADLLIASMERQDETQVSKLDQEITISQFWSQKEPEPSTPQSIQDRQQVTEYAKVAQALLSIMFSPDSAIGPDALKLAKVFRNHILGPVGEVAKENGWHQLKDQIQTLQEGYGKYIDRTQTSGSQTSSSSSAVQTASGGSVTSPSTQVNNSNGSSNAENALASPSTTAEASSLLKPTAAKKGTRKRKTPASTSDPAPEPVTETSAAAVEDRSETAATTTATTPALTRKSTVSAQDETPKPASQVAKRTKRTDKTSG